MQSDLYGELVREKKSCKNFWMAFILSICTYWQVPALHFESKQLWAVRNFCLKLLVDLLSYVILWKTNASPLGYQKQQMVSQVFSRTALFQCRCLILCLMLPWDFTYKNWCKNPKYIVAVVFSGSMLAKFDDINGFLNTLLLYSS